MSDETGLDTYEKAVLQADIVRADKNQLVWNLYNQQIQTIDRGREEAVSLARQERSTALARVQLEFEQALRRADAEKSSVVVENWEPIQTPEAQRQEESLKYLEDLLATMRDSARRGEDEGAHIIEDSLHAHTLDLIGRGDLTGEYAQRASALAYSTKDIQFARHCA